MNSTPVPTASDLATWCEALNLALKSVSDKDWNYSRISLSLNDLQQISAPYALSIDWLDIAGRQGQEAYKRAMQEVTWGARHSHELGVLELMSLRLNKAISEVTSDEHWNGIRPIVRLSKKSDLIHKGYTHAFWYQVQEVQGEEFENR